MIIYVKIYSLCKRDFMRPMLTIEELAEILRVSPRTVYRMLDNGEVMEAAA